MGSDKQDGRLIKALNLASTIAVLGIFFILSAWVIYALFAANPPVIVDEPLVIKGDEFRPGDTIEIVGYNICRLTDAQATAYITYYEVNQDKAYEVFSRPANAAPMECAEQFTIVETVPLIPPGTYERRSTIVYDLDLFVTREVKLTSTQFKILPLREDIEEVPGEF
jgi:hypothetical protein